MVSNAMQLQDDQKFALMKFRRSVHDVLGPDHDDYFLVRWLRARSWDAEAAEKMLRDSMKWRQRLEVDTTLKTWTAPETLLAYYPSGQAGFDVDGAPVVILPFAGLDVWGLLHTVSQQDIIKQTIKVLEEYLRVAKETGVNKVTVIIDMEGFNLKQYAWRPAGELVISLIKIYEANYPEILKQCFIINAPSVFALAFSIVKKFLNEYTISKIQICKGDKWRALFKDKIQLENLPKHYGGELVDPDGDPRCPSKIKLGGKVPKELYRRNLDAKLNSEEFKTAVVGNGKQFVIDFVVAEENCLLKWNFHSEIHDIKFGIKYCDEAGKTHEAVPLGRIGCQHVNEVGFLLCEYPATYSVIFDNSYSIFRNKVIHYDIQLTIPTAESSSFASISGVEIGQECDE